MIILVKMMAFFMILKSQPFFTVLGTQLLVNRPVKRAVPVILLTTWCHPLALFCSAVSHKTL